MQQKSACTWLSATKKTSSFSRKKYTKQNVLINKKVYPTYLLEHGACTSHANAASPCARELYLLWITLVVDWKQMYTQ